MRRAKEARRGPLPVINTSRGGRGERGERDAGGLVGEVWEVDWDADCSYMSSAVIRGVKSSSGVQLVLEMTTLLLDTLYPSGRSNSWDNRSNRSAFSCGSVRRKCFGGRSCSTSILPYRSKSAASSAFWARETNRWA
jgi:hypothetical protein